jgi:hypothetical protein
MLEVIENYELNRLKINMSLCQNMKELELNNGQKNYVKLLQI